MPPSKQPTGDFDAVNDPLTGALNRHGLDVVAAGLGATVQVASVSRRAAAAEPNAFAVVVLDLDHFRRVNDQFGFESGNAVLKALVALMRSVLRAKDSVTRLDDEKFCVLLPGANTANALQVAERIRREFNATPVVLGGVTTTLSLSAGVADSSGRADTVLDTVLQSANEALRLAKDAGRNRVVAFGAPDAHWPVSLATGNRRCRGQNRFDQVSVC